ncbi:MAG: GNAT family N-acetyltransferase, partial [Bdellovibrionales bacterium]|nr:GNAT family N-acetyltransferase [Bdellovibrionales bacterium]
MKHLDYDLKPIDLSLSGLREVQELMKLSFSGDAPSVEVLQWQYNENPLGPAIGYNAYCGTDLVGHYVTIPTQAMIKGEFKKGLLSLNTATHPSHQKKGLFSQLANLTYDKGKNTGFDFVVGVANHNSVYGFTKKLGFQHVGLLETRLFLRTPFLKKMDLDFSIVWNTDFLNWRLAKPGCKYFYRFQDTHLELYVKHIKAKVKILIQNLDWHNKTLPDRVNPMPAMGNPFKYWIGHEPRA